MRVKVLLAASLLMLAGCDEIETPDGAIPQEFISAAAPLQGTYMGSFQGVPTNLTLQLQGNKPVVVVANNNGNDLIGSKCSSKVGQLHHIRGEKISEGVYRLDNATFVFDAGNCFMQGRQLSLNFDKTQTKIRAEILHHVENAGCGPVSMLHTPPYIPPPTQPPHCTPTNVYWTGAFTK